MVSGPSSSSDPKPTPNIEGRGFQSRHGGLQLLTGGEESKVDTAAEQTQTRRFTPKDEVLGGSTPVAAAVPAKPKAEKLPTSICLALSGGGFRATLFHLGMVRYLYSHRWNNSPNDKCLLNHVHDIVAVSGGSITAASVVQHFDKYTASPEEFTAIATDVVRFTMTNLQEHILQGAHQSHFHNHAAALEHLYKNATLLSLHRTNGKHRSPSLHLMVTDLAGGRSVSLSSDRLRIFNGWAASEISSSDLITELRAPKLTVATAVAASSAFPSLLNPFLPTSHHLGTTISQDVIINGSLWADGGIYDNTGLDFVQRVIFKRDKPAHLVIASDAGKPFNASFAHEKQQNLTADLLGIFHRTNQAIDVQMQRLAFFDRLHHRSLALSRGIAVIEPLLHDPAPVQNNDEDSTDNDIALIQGIRTDFDSFTPEEVSSLVRRGYVELKRRMQMQYGSRVVPISDRTLETFLERITQLTPFTDLPRMAIPLAEKELKPKDTNYKKAVKTALYSKCKHYLDTHVVRILVGFAVIILVVLFALHRFGVFHSFRWGLVQIPGPQLKAKPPELLMTFDAFACLMVAEYRDGPDSDGWKHFKKQHTTPNEWSVCWDCEIAEASQASSMYFIAPVFPESSALSESTRANLRKITATAMLNPSEEYDSLIVDRSKFNHAGLPRLTIEGVLREVDVFVISLSECKIKKKPTVSPAE